MYLCPVVAVWLLRFKGGVLFLLLTVHAQHDGGRGACVVVSFSQDAFDGILKLTTAKGYSLGDIVQVGPRATAIL